MIDAPERIWFTEFGECGFIDNGGTEYVRADIAERQIAELRAEVAEHKRLAMDAIDETAEGFWSAVHFVRNNAMNMERDYPEICHAEEVFSRVRAALAGKE